MKRPRVETDIEPVIGAALTGDDPAAFLDTMISREYAAGNVDRENGTERHLILAMPIGYSKRAAPASAARPSSGPDSRLTERDRGQFGART